VAHVAPGQAAAVFDVLYEFSLDLAGRDYFGRCPVLVAGWRLLLGGHPHHLAEAPRRFAGAVTNALHHLWMVPGARPQQWLRDMSQLGQHCRDVATLLAAGTVAAWRAGLPHFREGALAVCRQLEPSLALAALGLERGTERPELEKLLDRLEADPWRLPAACLPGVEPAQELRVVATVGAFRGFGGVFVRPPRVAFAAGHFQAFDGETCWLVTADVFGATLHRAGKELPANEPNLAYRLDAKGRVFHQGRSRTFKELQDSTSFACDATTLAVTVPLSHSIYLIAWSEPRGT